MLLPLPLAPATPPPAQLSIDPLALPLVVTRALSLSLSRWLF